MYMYARDPKHDLAVDERICTRLIELFFYSNSGLWLFNNDNPSSITTYTLP